MEKLLANNSESMKTFVETFIVEETASLIYDNDQLDTWNKKVEELGLKGQTKVVQKEKSPIPFLWMNQTLISVFETLCPRKVDIVDYDKMPIPVEILELVSLSKREGYFDMIEIWYDDQQPDPVCIGYKYGEEREDWIKKHYAKKYLLGRWSDVKASFVELIERAKIRFKETRKSQLEQNIKMNQRELEDLDNAVQVTFGSATANTSGLLPF